MNTYSVILNNGNPIKINFDDNRIETSKKVFEDMMNNLEHPCDACALQEIVTQYDNLELYGERVPDETVYVLSISIGWLESIGCALKPIDDQEYVFPDFLLEKGQELGYIQEYSLGEYNLSMNVDGSKKVLELARLIENRIDVIEDDLESFFRGETKECPRDNLDKIEITLALIATTDKNIDHLKDQVDSYGIELYQTACFLGVISDGSDELDFDLFKAAYEAKLLENGHSRRQLH